jgi:threonine dehydratase
MATLRPSTPVRTNIDTPTNGTMTPQTPKLNGFALTEYTANPSPPTERVKSDALSQVPLEFLLPNGYPDVRSSAIPVQAQMANNY